MALILFKEIYKHSSGIAIIELLVKCECIQVFFSDILVVSALVATFIHANSIVQREVSKQVKREWGPLSVITLNIFACLTFVYVMCGDEQLYHM